MPISAFHIRWGDKSSEFPSANLAAQALKEIIQEASISILQMLRNSSSVLYRHEDYKLYLFSEPSMKGPSSKDITGNVSEFNEILRYFPKSKVEIRVNHSQHLEDVDIMSQADIFMIGRGHSFAAFILRHVLPSNALVLVRRLARPHGEYLPRPIMYWDELHTDFNIEYFNTRVCPFSRVPSIYQKCKNIGLDSGELHKLSIISKTCIILSLGHDGIDWRNHNFDRIA